MSGNWKRGFWPAVAALGLLLTAALPPAAAMTGGEVEKVAYLTYDDGPSRNTAHLLEVLEEEQVPATFFVIGREEDPYPELYRQMAEGGHALGLHSYSHKYGEIYRSVEALAADLEQLEALLERTTGSVPTILRFPGGSVNQLAPSRRELDEIVRWVMRRGYIYYDWNVVSGDDTAVVYPPEELAARVLQGAKGKDSVVVLFHDAPLCSTTAEATRLVIRALREQGYRFARLEPGVEPIQFNPIGGQG